MPEPVSPPPHIDVEVKIAKEENPRDAGLERLAEPSRYACPDCHGVLLEIEEGTRIRFRCHAGHAYSVESLLAAMSEGIERAVVATQRAFEESSLLMKRVASQLKEHNQHEASARMLEASERAKRRAEAIVELVRQDDPVPIAHE
jgi:two-component system chemotaxis response regulator CheB